jgi:hypothetical protein
LTFSAFTQTGTVKKDSSTTLPNYQLRAGIKDIVRLDSARLALMKLESKIKLMELNELYKDNIIAASKTAITTLTYQDSINQSYISKQALIIEDSEKINKDLTKQLKKKNIQNGFLKTGFVAVLAASITLLIVK